MSPFIPVLSKTHLEIRFSRHVPTWKQAPSQLGLFLFRIRPVASLFWFRSSRLPIITVILWAAYNVVLRIKQDIAREWSRRITGSHSSFIHLYHLPFLVQHWHNSATGLLWPMVCFCKCWGIARDFQPSAFGSGCVCPKEVSCSHSYSNQPCPHI